MLDFSTGVLVRGEKVPLLLGEGSWAKCMLKTKYILSEGRVGRM